LHDTLRVESLETSLKKHRLVFSMGYPYYIAMDSDLLAFTSDMGILVFKILH